MRTNDEYWRGMLRVLCDEIRQQLWRPHLEDGARLRRELAALGEPVREGAGDVTYGIDEIAESCAEAWFHSVAAQTPLSLLTEDSGWRHRGPGGSGTCVELPDFDHGGPRIVLDPIDGTRNLMADLRSAWTVVGWAPPGQEQPRLSDLTLGIVSELPDSRAARYRVLEAAAGGPCTLELRLVGDEHCVEERELSAGDDDRVDRGYFCFFRYAPDQRPALARIEARFFKLLAEREGADLRHVFDDQYISNAGQLALLSLGTYRMIADIRGWLARRLGAKTITSKPYDVAGAILCARAAGCVVEGPLGEPLDFPIDVTTPVDFVGFANEATAVRLRPSLYAALRD